LTFSAELELDVKTLLDYVNDWEYHEIQDLNESNVHEYLHQELFADYLSVPGDFTEGLIKQGISIMKLQNEGFLAKVDSFPNNPRSARLIVNPYWKQFVLTFVGTKFISNLNEQLSHELVTMLKRIVDTDTIEDQELLDFMLDHEPVDTIMREYLNDVMNNQFKKIDITVTKFKVFGNLLPILSSDMDANTARNLAIHFIKPVFKDKDCAQIIASKKGFYLGVLKKDPSSVQDIIKGILEDVETSDIYGDIKEEIIDLLIKRDDSDSSESD
jgi:hypothetical protein